MFDFIFKRSTRKSSPDQPAMQQPATPAQSVSDAQAALMQAERLEGESEALAFILQCQFADARLKAAAQVHSRNMLEQVLQHVRNADRRVAKLMQARLDMLKQQELSVQQAQRCVESAMQLAQDPQPMPGQAADLDRAWQAIALPPQALREQFEAARAVLRERLEAQAALQRSAIDLSARLRHLADNMGAVSVDDAAQALAGAEQEMTQAAASPEIVSLPRHLLAEYAQQRERFMQALKVREQQACGIRTRQEMLDGWEAAEASSLQSGLMKQAWHALPALPEDETGAGLQARFDALLARMPSPRKAMATSGQEAAADSKRQFAEALDGIEKALQDGALQIAADHAKTLRAIDLKLLRLDAAQSARLAKAQAELSSLQGWAKWGGNVSREELLKAAEELPQKSLAVPELAKRVGSLRERWKSLDVSAGPANKELWERFDQACTAAYAPAAAHFKKLAEERQQNLLNAQKLIAEIRQFPAGAGFAEADLATVDWKDVANFCTRITQTWQRLGPMERKEKKKLDAEFDSALRVLSEPLSQQRDAEIRRREKLIADAGNLNPNDRGALDTLRALQERWQEQSRSLPLLRKDEQLLWQRFRAACDSVFAKRKEVAVAADAERRKHLEDREAICATLENSLGMPDAEVAKALREAGDAWSRTGPVPRAAESRIEARYQDATAALQKQLNAAKRKALETERHALRDKLRLCQAVEAALLQRQSSDPAWLENWQKLPALPAVFERALRSRFDQALSACANSDSQYAASLEENRASLAQELLRAEILAGIESPQELSRERLQLQVEVLQSSLKSGQKVLTPEAQLLRLCALPADTDAQSALRLERLMQGMQT